MANINQYTIVDYEQYCKYCEHKEESDDYGTVCDKCLNEPARLNSSTPAYFKLNKYYTPSEFEKSLNLRVLNKLNDKS